MGIVSSLGAIATILAPYILPLSKVGGFVWVNFAFGVTMLLASALVFLLPETLNRPLPTSLNDL